MMAPLSIVSLGSMLDRVVRHGSGAASLDRLRMHPETWRRLVISKYGYTLAPLGETPARTLLGHPVEIDPVVRHGVVRVEYDLAPSEEETP